MSNLKEMYKNICPDVFPENLTVKFGETELHYQKKTWGIGSEIKGLRYGENPDQPAALYGLIDGELCLGGIKYKSKDHSIVSNIAENNMLQAGKHPGKTNFTDIDNAISILQYLHAGPAAIILKHNNPCGAARSELGITDALKKAYYSDRIAAFGGAIIVNRSLDLEAAELINQAYFEVVAAPDFETGVTEILKQRKNLRILKIEALAYLNKFLDIPFLDIKSLSDGGLIIQQSFINKIKKKQDFLPAKAEHENNIFIARTPTAREYEDLLFAWAIESGVSSNSVIFAKNGVTVAIGTGEQDKVGCIELTIHKAYTKYADNLAFAKTGLSLYELKSKAENNPEYAEILNNIDQETKINKAGLSGSVLVSDGFFPFRDGVDIAIAQGITAIAQPGGSLRDYEIVLAVNQACPQVGMVFTGQRAFKH